MTESTYDLLARKRAEIIARWDEDLAATPSLADKLGRVPLSEFNEYLEKILDAVVQIAREGEEAGTAAAGSVLASGHEHNMRLPEMVLVVSALRRVMFEIPETRERFPALLVSIDRVMQAAAIEVELWQGLGGGAWQRDSKAPAAATPPASTIESASQERDALARDLDNYRRYLDTVINQAIIPTAVFDKTGVLVHLNEAALAIISAPDLSALYGRYNVLHDEFLDATGNLALLERAFTGECVDIPPMAYDVSIGARLGPSAPGRNLLISGRAFPLLDEKGEVRFVVVTMDDALRRKPFDTESGRRGDRWMNDLLEVAVDGLAVVSLDGAILGYNSRLSEWTGYAPGEVTSFAENPGVFSDQAEYEKALHYLRRVAAGERVQFETSVVTKRGHKLCLDVTASLVVSRTPPVILVSLRDATERKMAEEKQRILLKAIESATDGIAVLDGRYYLLFANKTLCRIFGYESPYEILGRGLKRMFDEPAGKRLLDEVFPIAAEKGEWRGQVVGLRKDGEPITLDVSVAPVSSEGGGSEGVILVVREVASEEGPRPRLPASR